MSEYMTEEELRAYNRGREKAAELLSKPSPSPAPAWAAAPARPQQLVTVTDGLQPVSGRNRDYEAWRLTPAGRIHSLAYPDPSEAYQEVQQAAGPAAVRQLCDDTEITYGRRPPVSAVQAVLNARGWERGQAIAGSADDIQAMTRWAFPEWVIRNRGEDPPDVNQMTVHSQRQ